MNTADLAAFRDYVEKHSDKLIAPAFYTFKTATVVSHLPENKGKETVTIGSVMGEIVGPWKELSYADAGSDTSLSPEQIETELVQFAENFVPEKLEKTYLGHMRRTGQDPKDYPIEAFMLDLLTKGIAKSNENAFWKAVEIPNPTKLSEMFDGVLKQIEDAITAGDITPVVLGQPFVPRSPEQEIPAGSTDIVDMVEAVVEALPEDVQQEGVYVYMSSKMKRDYEKTYRNRFGTTSDGDRFNIRRGKMDETEDMGEINVVGVPGLNNSQRIKATPMRNIWYSYDVEDDASNFNFDSQLNQMYVFGAYRFGARVLMRNDEWVAVNELP